jgi:hypothetical protein
LLHSRVETDRRLILVGHKIEYFIAAVLAVFVGKHRRQHSKPTLKPHADMKASPLPAISCPAFELVITNPMLGLLNRATTNAIQHQFVPQFIKVG